MNLNYSKIDSYIEFPLTNMGMTNYVVEIRGQQLLYNLFAVTNHYGDLSGGHYTAFCKNADNGKWQEFNDSPVSEFSELNVFTKAAYILYYRKADNKWWVVYLSLSGEI